jgi:hypothetical protein
MALTENCALACQASASNTMPSDFFWVLGSGAARHELPETYGPPEAATCPSRRVSTPVRFAISWLDRRAAQHWLDDATATVGSA